MKCYLSHHPLFGGLMLGICLWGFAGWRQSAFSTSVTYMQAKGQKYNPLFADQDNSGIDPAPHLLTLANITTDTIPMLIKPNPLQPIQVPDTDPLPWLDQLVVKPSRSIFPYVPWIQEVSIGLDYIRPIMKIFSNSERSYEGSLGMLWRGNIELVGSWGNRHLHPKHSSTNLYEYEVKGSYGRIGLNYLSKYKEQDNVYTGIYYGRSHFTNATKPSNTHPKAISKHLEASWFELVIGADTQLFAQAGLHAGIAFRLAILYSFQQFEPARNYIVPGYGRTSNKVVFTPIFYIQWRLSFLKKFASFSQN